MTPEALDAIAARHEGPRDTGEWHCDDCPYGLPCDTADVIAIARQALDELAALRSQRDTLAAALLTWAPTESWSPAIALARSIVEPEAQG